MSNNLNRRDFVSQAALGAGAVWLGSQAAFAKSSAGLDKPNIVMILADDLGYGFIQADGGLTAGGKPVSTPNLNKLAKNGVRFTHAHACAMCGPTRQSLLTGKNLMRFSQPSFDTPFIPALMKQAGYTTGHSGKMMAGQFYNPNSKGFDEAAVYCGHYEFWDPRVMVFGSKGYLKEFNQPTTLDKIKGGDFYMDTVENVYKEGSATILKGQFGPDVFNKFCTDFIHRNKSVPFFLNYAPKLVHVPYPQTPDIDQAPGYADSIRYLDKLVGNIIQQLTDDGIINDTLIFFMGDNGHKVQKSDEDSCELGQTCIPGQKGGLSEGATRVPLIVQWGNGGLKGVECNDLVDIIDLLPTFVEAGKGSLPKNEVFDGRSFLPQITGKKANPRDWIYVHGGHHPIPLADELAPFYKELPAVIRYVIGTRYKLYGDGRFYDLNTDMEEKNIIQLNNGSKEAEAARKVLQAVLNYYDDRSQWDHNKDFVEPTLFTKVKVGNTIPVGLLRNRVKGNRFVLPANNSQWDLLGRLQKRFQSSMLMPMLMFFMATLMFNALPTSAYDPVLPKVQVEPDSIIVLDYAIDDTNLGTLTNLQGLVNRKAALQAKGKRIFVYIKNVPCRFYQVEDAVAGGEDVIWKNNLVPYPKITPALDKKDVYPSLLYLMKRYSSMISSYVVSPGGTWPTGGARAAAFNAVVFEGNDTKGYPLYVETRTWDFLKQKGYNFPVLYNIVEMNMSNEEAFDWSIKKGYLQDSRRNKKIVAYGGVIYPNMLDYFICTYTFNYCLYKNSPTRDSLPIDSRIAQLAPYYNPAALHIGPVEGGHVLPQIAKNGQVGTPSWIGNTSVTSAMPSEKAGFLRSNEPKADASIDINGMYISWQSSDGDAIDVASYSALKNILQRDKNDFPVPFIRKVTPYMIDLFPALLGHWSSLSPETMEIAPSLADGGLPSTAEGKIAYKDVFARYMEVDNDVYRSFHYMGYVPANVDQSLGELSVPWWFMGYDGKAAATEWRIWENTLLSNMTLPRDATPDSSLIMLQNIGADASKKGKPIFLLLRENFDYEEILALHKILVGDAKIKSSGRKLYFRLPRDLAATYKKWYHASRHSLASESFEKTSTIESVSRVPNPGIINAGSFVGKIGIGNVTQTLKLDLPPQLKASSGSWEMRMSGQVSVDGSEKDTIYIQGFVSYADNTGKKTKTNFSQKKLIRGGYGKNWIDYSREIELPQTNDYIIEAGFKVGRADSKSGTLTVYLDSIVFDELSQYDPNAIPLSFSEKNNHRDDTFKKLKSSKNKNTVIFEYENGNWHVNGQYGKEW